ncbi:MAG: polysaccharide pyruvyl transferase family protein [Mycobacterium sp.]
MTTHANYVRVHGAFEVENFGDILLMRIFADWVRQAGWEPLVVDPPPYVCRELRLRADVQVEPKAVLLVGGGYLGEPNRRLLGRWRWGHRLIKRHLPVLEQAKCDGVPYAVVGVGLGPITNLLARRKTRSLLAGAQLNVLRDRESADWATRYGMKVDAVSADAAIALSSESLSVSAIAECERIRDLAQGRKIVALQLDRDSSAGEDWRMLFRCLTECLVGKDCYLLGISDQAGTEVSRMHQTAAETFLEKFPNSRFEHYGGVDSLMGRLYAADLIITSKLHVGIVASAFGRSVLSLPTHQKTVRFYRQLGRESICVPRANWEPATIVEAFEDAYGSADRLLPQLASLKNASLSNADYTRNFLASIA